MDSATYYQHSGRVGITTPAYYCVFGFTAVIALSIFYGFITSKAPIIYMNFIFLVMYSMAIGLVVSKCSIMGKVRNIKIAICVGLLFSCIGHYFAWVTWFISFNSISSEIFLSFKVLTQVANLANEGSWAMFGWHPPAAFYFMAWGAELLITAVTVSVLILKNLQMPFCEQCKSWIDIESCITPLPHIKYPSELVSQLESGDLSYLNTIKRLTHFESKHSEIIIRHCKNCQGMYLMDINMVILPDTHANQKLQCIPVVQNIHIDRKMYDTIVSL